MNFSPASLNPTVGNIGWNDMQMGMGETLVRVTRAVRTGVISVNTSRSVRTEAPFGGFKRSGIGRELGMAAMDHYTEVKNVFYSEEE